MKLTLAIIAFLFIAAPAVGQTLPLPMGVGPDPRGTNHHRYNPLWGVLVVRVEEFDENRTKWIIKGYGVGWEPSGRVFNLGATSLHMSKRRHSNLRYMFKLGDYIAAENPYETRDGVYLATKVVRKISKPAWWHAPPDAKLPPPPPLPKINHPQLGPSSPTKFEYHPVPASAPELSIEDVVAQALPAVFTYYSPGGVTAVGTGFVINEKGIAITNRHVAEDYRTFQAQFKNGRRVEGIVLGVSDEPELDLALVDLDGDGYLFLPLDTKPALQLALGTEVILIGTPERKGHTVTNGIISSVRIEKTVRTIQTNAAANSGNSGSPLILKTGAVVGVMSWHLTNTEGLNFAISIEEAIYHLPLRAWGPCP